MSNINKSDDVHMKEENDDEVVKEIDVYLANSLANNIYILQYPIRPVDRNYDESKYIGARVKSKMSQLELEMSLNTTNDNYSKAKGEQFALNVDGKQTLLNNPKQSGKDQPAQRYYRSNFMDKQVYTSSNGTLGQMSRLYQLGLLKDDKIHLNPIQRILQMKPSFEYFDIYEKKVKEAKDAHAADTDYSTEEEDNEVDKAELVTLKYSSGSALKQSQEQDQQWTPITYLNLTEPNSKILRESLVCKNQENKIKFDYSQEEFINRLIDNNNVQTSEKPNLLTPKLEKN